MTTTKSKPAVQVLLIIGWRESRGRYKLGRVDTEKPITDHLASLVSAQEARMAEDKAKPYSVEATVVKGEYFVAKTVEPEEEAALRAQLRSVGAMPLITADTLEKTGLSFYAAVVGDEADKVRAYIKKTNPVKVAKAGGLQAIFGDALTKLEDPVFTIAGDFDLVMYPDRLVILREAAFEALFYEETGLLEKVPGWVNKIRKTLPMDKAVADKLVETCKKSPRLLSKLQAIEARGHLNGATMEGLRRELRRLRIQPTRFIANGRLIVPDKYARQLMEVLNEDLFRGGFSGDDFAAEKKIPATVD